MDSPWRTLVVLSLLVSLTSCNRTKQPEPESNAKAEQARAEHIEAELVRAQEELAEAQDLMERQAFEMENRSALVEKQLAEMQAALAQQENAELRSSLDALSRQNEELKEQAIAARAESETLARKLETAPTLRAVPVPVATSPSPPIPPSTATGRTPPESPRDYTLFYEGLSPYGSWIDIAEYGYSWQPYLASDPGWKPYRDGCWTWTDHGWAWNSNEPFGWATYHYGRWVDLNHVGWVWVPGFEWAPAWVSWRQAPDHVGWAPLPPRRDRYRGADRNCDLKYDLGPKSYQFITTNQFVSHNYTRIYAPVTDNTILFRKSVNTTCIVPHHRRDRSDVFVQRGGPSRTQIEIACRTRVAPTVVRNEQGHRPPRIAPTGSLVSKRPLTRFCLPVATSGAPIPAPKIKKQLQATTPVSAFADLAPAKVAAMKQEMAKDVATVEAMEEAALESVPEVIAEETPVVEPGHNPDPAQVAENAPAEGNPAPEGEPNSDPIVSITDPVSPVEETVPANAIPGDTNPGMAANAGEPASTLSTGESPGTESSEATQDHAGEPTTPPSSNPPAEDLAAVGEPTPAQSTAEESETPTSVAMPVELPASVPDSVPGATKETGENPVAVIPNEPASVTVETESATPGNSDTPSQESAIAGTQATEAPVPSVVALPVNPVRSDAEPSSPEPVAETVPASEPGAIANQPVQPVEVPEPIEAVMPAQSEPEGGSKETPAPGKLQMAESAPEKDLVALAGEGEELDTTARISPGPAEGERPGIRESLAQRMEKLKERSLAELDAVRRERDPSNNREQPLSERTMQESGEPAPTGAVAAYQAPATGENRIEEVTPAEIAPTLRMQKEEEERAHAEAEAQQAAMEAEKQKAEELARAQAAQQAEMEATRQLAEEKARAEAEAQQAAMEAEKQRAEELARAQAAAAQQAEMESARRLAEEKAHAEAEAQQAAMEAEKQRAEELARAQAAAAQQAEMEAAKRQAEERARAEAAAQQAAMEAARRQAEEAARRAEMEAARRQAEERARAEAEARRAAEEAARRQAEEAARRAEMEAARRQAEERARAEAEARRAAEEAARRQAEEAARRAAEEAAKRQAESAQK